VEGAGFWVLGVGGWGSVLEAVISASKDVRADNADLRRFFVMRRLSPFRGLGCGRCWVLATWFWVLGAGCCWLGAGDCY